MEQLSTNSQLAAEIISRLNKGHKKDDVIDGLLQAGYEEYFARQIVAETIKLRNSKLTAGGLKLVLAGAALCLLSCILALTSTGNFHFVMFGMTSVGIIIVFAGLMKIF
jgi:hypothetical protein